MERDASKKTTAFLSKYLPFFSLPDFTVAEEIRPHDVLNLKVI